MKNDTVEKERAEELASLERIKAFVIKEGFTRDSDLVRLIHEEMEYVKRGGSL